MKCCSVRISWRFVNPQDADGEDDNDKENSDDCNDYKGCFLIALVES